jgi:spore coat polysaccharide biosynthesis predicted glycosyltransferase SpsG
MRARALARALDVIPAVSIRGGREAWSAARVLGCRVLEGVSVLRGADLLILDDPSLTHGRRWVESARRCGVRCVSVHDGTRTHDVDMAVDGRLGARSRRSATPTLTGVRFCILDHRIPIVGKARREVSPRARRRVLIALGGGVHVRRMAQRVVDAVHQRNPGASIVVASGFVRHPPPPLRHAKWLSAKRGLIGPLRSCDVALVAGGVTLYEACALGVPSVGLAVVRGQRRSVRSFARRRAILDAGGPPASAAAIARAAVGVARLLEEDGLRRNVVNVARRLVDGRGARRVAARILTMLGPGVRPA